MPEAEGFLLLLVGVLGLCSLLASNPAGVASINPKQVLDLCSAPTPGEPLVLVQASYYRNQKRPKGLFDFYGGGTWTRTKDTACIRRML